MQHSKFYDLSQGIPSMCGIAGFIDKKGVLNPSSSGKKLVQTMVKTIEHRGRDDSGYFHNKNLYFGHTRLAIIDLTSRGHQPMLSQNKKLVITYNGEIYNFQSTKKKLKKDYSFTTATDTEVLLRAYEKWGFIESLSKHKGMFAFALFDQSNQNLYLAIDRFGIKPLYYLNNDHFFAFASEIKALLTLPRIIPKLNEQKLEEYMSFRYLSGEQTLFQNIFKLEPAQWLRIHTKNNSFSRGTYWSLKKKRLSSRMTHEQQLQKILQKSVKEHLITDAPLGLQLSGGVDSSLIAAFAARIKKKQFHSFSIGLKDQSWNEFKYSKIVSRKLKTIHHQYKFTELDFCKLLPKLTYHMDEPISHSHSVPMFILAKKARQTVKVLLTGEGADEIFGGYSRYEPLVAGKPSNQEIIMAAQFGNPKTLQEILNHRLSDKFPLRKKIISAYSNMNIFDRVSMLDQKTYLLSLLIRQDKMGMAANVENRVPYLDYKLVEFAFSLPLSEKIQQKKSKIILKKIAKKYIPRECIDRKKIGFGQPIDQWLRNPVGFGRYLKLLTQGPVRRFINYSKLKKIIAEHTSGKKNHSQTLWILINLEIWMKIFIEREDYRFIWSRISK